VGEEGLEMVEYVGWLDSDYYVGDVTEAVYAFGLLERKKGFVDKRDIEGLLEIVEDGQKVFINGSDSN
jgi:hypothetical protein